MVFLRNTFISLLEIVTLLNQIDAFKIEKTSLSPQGPVKVGSTVELSCQTDDHYEYCDWWVGEFDEQKECRFEWKSKHGAVKKQKCPTLKDRIQFDGDYDAHECKVVLSNVGLADAGVWTCKIEEYATFGRGPVRRKKIKLDVFSEKDHKNSGDVSTPKHKDKPTDTVRIVSITPNDGKVVENSVGFSLECKAEGTPTPNIAWKTVHGKQLPKGARDLGDGTLLFSDSFTKIHEGTYDCHATNEVGSAVKQGITLMIDGKEIPSTTHDQIVSFSPTTETTKVRARSFQSSASVTAPTHKTTSRVSQPELSIKPRNNLEPTNQGTTPKDPSNKDKQEGDNSVIIWIVVGVVIFLGIVAILLVYQRRKNRRENNEGEKEECILEDPNGQADLLDKEVNPVMPVAYQRVATEETVHMNRPGSFLK